MQFYVHYQDPKLNEVHRILQVEETDEIFGKGYFVKDLANFGCGKTFDDPRKAIDRILTEHGCHRYDIELIDIKRLESFFIRIRGLDMTPYDGFQDLIDEGQLGFLARDYYGLVNFFRIY